MVSKSEVTIEHQDTQVSSICNWFLGNVIRLKCSAYSIASFEVTCFLKAMARKVSQKVITVESTVYDSLKMATTCT